MNSIEKNKPVWEIIETLSGEIMIPFGVHRRLIVKSVANTTISIEDRASLELVVLDALEDAVELRILLAGEDASAWVRSVMIVNGLVKKNITISIEHVCSRTTADSRVRAAIFDSGVLTLNGIAKISAGIADINTYFSGHELLMSEGARGDVVPSLEILSDEVKAGHSASVGSLDELDLFYFESRGITRESSQQQLMEGFLLSDIPDGEDHLIDEIKIMISDRLSKVH